MKAPESSISGGHLMPGSIADLQGIHSLTRLRKAVTTDMNPTVKASKAARLSLKHDIVTGQPVHVQAQVGKLTADKNG